MWGGWIRWKIGGNSDFYIQFTSYSTQSQVLVVAVVVSRFDSLMSVYRPLQLFYDLRYSVACAMLMDKYNEN